ncbi:hypothetical protein CFIO01_12759 [Colletotrichum fioriniae PJ7]|uniref:Uncharacterized protein n=1 Tax=Colletotrichum fioriniae PJ7 TaxID=1445577 RepID=A0A010QN89_9PEZI|nr:hypothetical protein CFIO01_12759 [Colletotrichum fioriniae PJ7]
MHNSIDSKCPPLPWSDRPPVRSSTITHEDGRSRSRREQTGLCPSHVRFRPETRLIHIKTDVLPPDPGATAATALGHTGCQSATPRLHRFSQAHVASTCEDSYLESGSLPPILEVPTDTRYLLPYPTTPATTRLSGLFFFLCHGMDIRTLSDHDKALRFFPARLDDVHLTRPGHAHRSQDSSMRRNLRS